MKILLKGVAKRQNAFGDEMEFKKGLEEEHAIYQ